ncbi:MAG: N-acetylmuramoyl-L-alanine amidase, partial [Gemmatimonadota bacterium]|nr:N-acetylmuramoyl-L-alanine amidase [Gemmatimonadota bacterium]
PIVAQAGIGRSIRADLLAEALGGQLIALPEGKFRFTLDDRTLNMTVGTPLVSTDSGELPMIAAPMRVDGRLYVPLATATELLPRVFNGLLFDEDRHELRRFSAIALRAHNSALPPAKTSEKLPVANPASAPSNRSGSTAATPPHRRTVVVDAGHGGPDNGMTGPLGVTKKVREKDITLAVARSLQQSLERRGLSVVMTRTTDTLIALGDRGKMANQAKGDLFISVHVNAANPHWTHPATARGFETYFLAEAKTEDEKRVEEMENQSIRFETSAETSRGDPLGFIIRDMAQNEHLRESSKLAELIQRELKAIHPGPSRGIKQAGFSVLVHAFMPAVLVEVGFGSNSAESAFMSDAVHQKELAEAIADAAAAYLAQYERKVGPGIP